MRKIPMAKTGFCSTFFNRRDIPYNGLILYFYSHAREAWLNNYEALYI